MLNIALRLHPLVVVLFKLGNYIMPFFHLLTTTDFHEIVQCVNNSLITFLHIFDFGSEVYPVKKFEL